MEEKIKYKYCSKCKKELPMTPYYFHKGQTKDGFKTQCKVCSGFKYGISKERIINRKSWTNQQIDFLIENYSITNMNDLVNILHKSKYSINSMSVNLHLFKDNLLWNNNELNLLKINYPSCIDVEVLRNNYLPNRSTLAIKKKACELNLKNNNIDNIRRINLSGYIELGRDNLNYTGNKSVVTLCRNRLLNWIESIKLLYNNQCQLTNIDTNVIVHHIRPFKQIFNTVLKEYEKLYDFKIYDSIKEYYDLKEENILDNFINSVIKEHTLDDGILIHNDLHKLFHSSKLYGSKNCSKDDFDEFKIRYFNGEFNNNLGINFSTNISNINRYLTTKNN